VTVGLFKKLYQFKDTIVVVCHKIFIFSVVCRSVGLSVGLLHSHTSDPCKNGWTDRDAVWVEDSGGPRESCVRWVQIPHGKGQFWGEKGMSHCKE